MISYIYREERKMTRIQPIDKQKADISTIELLGQVKKKFGSVPNLISTMAQSYAAARAYLDFNQALSAGNLSSRTREQIALLVSESNSCEYCLSAHTAFADLVGLDDQEILEARQGTAQSDKERAALEFVKTVLHRKGAVTDNDVVKIRNAGFSDGEIIEIVANIAVNIFTNYVNNIAVTEVDFPKVPRLAAA